MRASAEPCSSTVAEPDTDPRPFRVLRLLWWTIPLHALLPLLIAWLGRECEQAMIWAWWIIHLGFPGVLIVGYPRWRGQGEAVVAVIAINHVVMLIIGVGLMTWVWG